MLEPGTVVVVDFPGAHAAKRRPAVIICTREYQTHRPDVIVGPLTTNLAAASAPSDHILRDWPQAGLRQPSAFRTFLLTLPDNGPPVLGKLSPHDWRAVQECIKRSIAVP